MRHRKAGRKFNMDASARKAMIRAMVSSLMLHGRITTTEARAKELRRFAEHLITVAKRAPGAPGSEDTSSEAQVARAGRVHAIRQARLWVNDTTALNRLFNEYAPLFSGRNGGYTRVIKTGFRKGDNAAMAIIELVDLFQDAAVA